VNCIYCNRETISSVSHHHVVPYAAGNTAAYRRVLGEITAPRELYCDSCEHYFGEALDVSLASFPYVAQWRAVYGMRGRGAAPSYITSDAAVETTRSRVLALSGPGARIDRQGNVVLPRPSLKAVDHFLVSRAIHRAALEFQILRILKQSDLDAARVAVQQEPLVAIARYVRYGQRRDYRPYGVEAQGATMVNISPLDFEPDPQGRIVGPPQFTGYIIAMPGARFSCTLAADPSLLAFMLKTIEETEVAPYMMTRQVFWRVGSGGIVPGDALQRAVERSRRGTRRSGRRGRRW
jgi:hypothetical protein